MAHGLSRVPFIQKKKTSLQELFSELFYLKVTRWLLPQALLVYHHPSRKFASESQRGYSQHHFILPGRVSNASDLLQICPRSNPWTLWISYPIQPKRLCWPDKLKAWKCGDYPEYLSGPNVIIRFLIRGRQEGPSNWRDKRSSGQRQSWSCHSAGFEDRELRAKTSMV